MVALHVTEPDEETGMVAVITDEPCPSCGWSETVLHIWPDGATRRGCPSCESEWLVAGTTVAHDHVLQGDGEGCAACASIRPESQVHPHLVPPLPAAYVPTSFVAEDDDPETPAHVEALPEAVHRIVDERAVCTGGIESRCHWYPDSNECDHEAWPCGHEYVFHDECWMIQWLNAVDLYDTASDDAADARIGEDALRWPNGVIDYEWGGDYVTWSYVSIDPHPEPVLPPDGRRESDVPLWDDDLTITEKETINAP